MKTALLTIAVLLSLFAPATAGADDGLDEAFKLHERAVAARDAGDYEVAERLFRQSLTVKDLNVTWLNLGQLYGLMGKCAQARTAFERVPDAEPVSTPPRERVLAVLAERRTALGERCPEGVVELEQTAPEAPAANYTFGIVLAGLGTAGLLTATVIDATVLRKRFDRLEQLQGDDRPEYEEAADKTRSLQVANVIAFAGSGAVLAAGIVVIAVTAGKDTRVALAPTPGGVGFVVTKRF